MFKTLTKILRGRTDIRPLAELYIETLKSSLLNELYIENEVRIVQTLARRLNNSDATLEEIYKADPALQALIRELKQHGRTVVLSKTEADGSTNPDIHVKNYTHLAHTMIGRKRLDNIQHCVEQCIKTGIPGDLMETGIWRGGATIFMRGVLAAYGITERRVWAADSFQGVPSPSHSEDKGFDLSKGVCPVLSVGRQEVTELYQRYGLLDDKTVFLEGWFKDTLAKAPIESLAILRLDGDLYESTMDALNPLYKKVSRGGFVIVDDYGTCPPCARAIDDFRAAHGILDRIQIIDDQSVYWRKS